MAVENGCYRRESTGPYWNCRERQEHGRTGWRSKDGRKHVNVSPMCPRRFPEVVPTPRPGTLKSRTQIRSLSVKRYLVGPSRLSLRLASRFSTVFGRFCSQVVPKFWAEPLRWHNFFVHSFRLGKGFLRVSCGLPTQLMLMRNIAGQRSRITVAAMLEAMIAVVHDRLSDRAPPRQKRG